MQGRLNGYNTGSRIDTGDFPGGSVVKSLPASEGDMGSIPGQEGSHMRLSI